MLRILRAFAWLRWRTLLNSLERTGSRDVIGRMSVALEGLAPVIMALLLLPSALALAGLAGYAGWSVARTGEPALPFESVRLLLLAACVFAILAPIILPAGGRPSAVRLLLLPVPRRVLYAGQIAAALTEPWMLLAVAIVMALPIGLAAGGEPLSAAVALLAGALLMGTLTGTVLTMTSAIDLVMRNRRRGEALTLLLFLLLPLLPIMFGLTVGELGSSREHPAEHRASPPRNERSALERRTLALLPSESYVRAIRVTRRAEDRAVWPSLLRLAGTLTVLHAAALVMFTRTLATPGMAGARGGSSGSAFTRWRLPGLSTGASAVALGQLRLVLRTPRGRFTLLSPLVIFVPLAVMLLRSRSGFQLAVVTIDSGLGLAVLTSFISLLAILPFSMNQFAIDRAGLTLLLLAPLGTRALLGGKAVGNALVAALPAAVCIAGSLALFPVGDVALWLSLPLAFTATYVTGAPVAAALSAVFPRSVDLNSIGHGSNAHGAAAFLGTLLFTAAGTLSLLPFALATALLQRPWLTPVFLLGWTVACAVASLWLFRHVADLFERRRETVLMTR